MASFNDLMQVVASNWQGIVALIALFVAFNEYRLRRIEVETQHLAREVRIEALTDEIRLTSGNQKAAVAVRVINDTGSPQVVRDLWLRIVDYPTDISDQQAEGISRMTWAFMQSASELFERPDTISYFDQLAQTPTFRSHWMIRLMGYALNVHDKVRKGRVELKGPNRYIRFAIGSMKRDLRRWSRVFSGPQRLLIGRLTFARTMPFRAIESQASLPVTKSINVDFAPKAVHEIECDLARFRDEVSKALSFVGGEFRFGSMIEARVAGSNYRSESDLVDVIVSVPSPDWDRVLVDLKKAIGETKFPPKSQ